LKTPGPATTTTKEIPDYPTLQMVEYEGNPTTMLQLMKLCKSLNQMDIH
jgi:hypothetical protein